MKYISLDTRCDMCEKPAKHMFYSKENDWEIGLCDNCLMKMNQLVEAGKAKKKGGSENDDDQR